MIIVFVIDGIFCLREITPEAREEFEGYFTNQVVSTLLPADQTVNTLRKQNLKQNDLKKGDDLLKSTFLVFGLLF